MSDARKMYYEEGFDGYVEKPIQGRVLENEVLRFIPDDIIEYREDESVSSEAVEPMQRLSQRKRKKIYITTDCTCDIPQELLDKYDINTRVGTFVNNFPYNYDERLVPVCINGKRIDFYTASLEDIVIAKLCSGRATDVQDIIDPRVLAAVDWKRLEYLATDENEARASALNPFRYEEFLDSYKTYVERWCPCGN